MDTILKEIRWLFNFEYLLTTGFEGYFDIKLSVGVFQSWERQPAFTAELWNNTFHAQDRTRLGRGTSVAHATYVRTRVRFRYLSQV